MNKIAQKHPWKIGLFQRTPLSILVAKHIVYHIWLSPTYFYDSVNQNH